MRPSETDNLWWHNWFLNERTRFCFWWAAKNRTWFEQTKAWFASERTSGGGGRDRRNVCRLRVHHWSNSANLRRRPPASKKRRVQGKARGDDGKSEHDTHAFVANFVCFLRTFAVLGFVGEQRKKIVSECEKGPKHVLILIVTDLFTIERGSQRSLPMNAIVCMCVCLFEMAAGGASEPFDGLSSGRLHGRLRPRTTAKDVLLLTFCLSLPRIRIGNEMWTKKGHAWAVKI